jgi:hypothetical protein
VLLSDSEGEAEQQAQHDDGDTQDSNGGAVAQVSNAAG